MPYLLIDCCSLDFSPTSMAYSLTKIDVCALANFSLAFGSGVAAAVYLMRRFGVEDDFVWGRAVFWPTVWIVGALVFIVGALALNILDVVGKRRSLMCAKII